jgi:hypothetical protein
VFPMFFAYVIAYGIRVYLACLIALLVPRSAGIFGSL